MVASEVGKKSPVTMTEGVRFDLSSAGATLIYAFDAPTTDEVAQVRSGNGFEIRFAEINDILWVTTKCGNLEWTDAPYNPRLSSGLPDPDFADGEGIALTFVLIDSATGIVKAVRLIGLGNRFSHYLTEKALELREKTMTMTDAVRSINQTMNMYDSRQLASLASSQARFRLQ